MLRKALLIVLALAAFATAACIAVIALAVALYATLAPHLGLAGAAAVLAVVIIGVLLLLTFLLTLRSSRRPDPQDDTGLIHNLIEMAKAKPLLAAGAAVAAGILAVRNPAVIAALLAAFLNRPRSND